MIIVKDQFFQTRTLAKYDGTTEYVDDSFVTNITPSNDPTVKIFKAQRSIYFVNCDVFKKQLFQGYGFSPIDRFIGKNLKRNDVVAINPNYVNGSCDLLVNLESIQQDEFIVDKKPEKVVTEETNDPDIILDFSAVNYVDTNGVKMLDQLIEDFKKIGVTLYICEPQGKFFSMKKNSWN